MQIQWQVVSEQIDIVVQQGFQVLLFYVDYVGVFIFLEVIVMYQYYVGVGFYGGIQQCLVGSDFVDDLLYLWLVFDLQVVWVVVLDVCGIQIMVGFFDQGVQGDSYVNFFLFRQGVLFF